MDFDQIIEPILDWFDSAMPSIFAFSTSIYNNYKNHIKLFIVLAFTVRILYRLFYLKMTRSTYDLRLKLAMNIFNIVVLSYYIYSEIKTSKETKKN